jgi:hypothetical protein
VVFLTGALAFAQDVPDAPAQDQGAAPAAQPYGGPALLDRGEGASVLGLVGLPPLRPYLGVTGVFLSNSEGFYGVQNSDPGYGVSGVFGITGSRGWSHGELDVDYHGSYQKYVPDRQQNGLDNSLNLGIKQQLTPHLSLSLTEDVSRVRNFFALPMGTLYGGGTSGFNPLYNALAGSGLTNGPSLASVSGALTYQLTARLSASAGGTGIVSREEITPQAVGANGWVASGDIAYRLTRYQTLSFGYSFTHFDYVGQFGQADIHGFDLSYALRLGRFWELAASAGVSRSETVGEVLDPVLAQLLGVAAVLVRTDNVSYMPTGSARLTRSFHHAQWSANYDRTVLGGGGFYTSSTYESAGSTFNYSGLRRISLDAGAGYYRFASLSQGLGRYHSFGFSGGFGVPMGMGFSWFGRIDWRHYSLAGSQDQASYNASLGIAWRPSRLPFSLR